MTKLAALYDHQCAALIESGTAQEKQDALAEMVERGLAFSSDQLKANRKPRPIIDGSGTWGWRGRD